MVTGRDRGFSGSRLRVARSFAGLSRAELGERVSVSYQFIAYLETDQKRPTDVTAAALAEVCGVQRRFFEGEDLDEFLDEECHFRRRQTTSVSMRTRVLAHGTLFGQLVTFLDANLSLPAMNVPHKRIKTHEEIERAADQCRMHWGLGRDTPITNISRVLENAGVVVTRFDVDAEKVDAFSRAGGGRDVVVLNSGKGCASRDRFNMAHECGHLVMHGGLVTGGVDREQEADTFASALLMPRAGFIQEFPRTSRLDWPALFRLKSRWGVSVAAIVRRAYDLRLITAQQYQRAFKYMSAQGWRKGEPGEPDAESPEMIAIAAGTLAEQGLRSPDVADSLGWTTSTLSTVSGGAFVEIEDASREQIAKIIPLRSR